MQACVLNFVDYAHPATAQLLKDPVVGDVLADERVGTRYSAAILGCNLR